MQNAICNQNSTAGGLSNGLHNPFTLIHSEFMYPQRRLREAQEALRKAAQGPASDEQPLLKQFMAQSDQLRTAVLQAAVDQQRVRQFTIITQLSVQTMSRAMSLC